MHPSLLQYLKCPQCAHDTLELSVKIQNDKEILAGDLGCPACKRIFPIVDSIPNFLPEEETDKPWRKAWSYKWDHVAKDVRYSEEGDEDFEIKMNYSGLFSRDLSGKLALDAGCGSGQDTARIARLGAEIIAVDQSTGVYQARKFNAGKNYRSLVHFIRADIFNLPLKNEIFDLIYSNGVLHHTPDTRRAFDSIAPLLKQGGDIAIWVYDRTQYWRLFETFWRPVLSPLASSPAFTVSARGQSSLALGLPLPHVHDENRESLGGQYRGRISVRSVQRRPCALSAYGLSLASCASGQGPLYSLPSCLRRLCATLCMGT